MPWLQLRFDYDTTTIRLYDVSSAPASIRRDSTRAKMNMSIFRRSRIVVEWQLWYRLKWRCLMMLDWVAIGDSRYIRKTTSTRYMWHTQALIVSYLPSAKCKAITTYNQLINTFLLKSFLWTSTFCASQIVLLSDWLRTISSQSLGSHFDF